MDKPEMVLKEWDAVKQYRIRLVKPARGGVKLDLREYVSADTFEGFTKRGIRLDLDDIKALYTRIGAVLAHMERREEPKAAVAVARLYPSKGLPVGATRETAATCAHARAEYLDELSSACEDCGALIPNHTPKEPVMYDVKCDDCKRTIRQTEDVRASYAGGRCNLCQSSTANVQTRSPAKPATRNPAPILPGSLEDLRARMRRGETIALTGPGSLAEALENAKKEKRRNR